MERKNTEIVKVGNIKIGGGHPISIQTMTNTDTKDIEKTLAQIRRMEEAGSDIVRLAVYDMECIPALKEIVANSKVPLVADIHFDHRLALAAMEAGIDKLRINPGNIGSKEAVYEIVNEAKKLGIAIRIGVNGGSLKKEFLYKYGNTPKAMVESALEQIALLEKYDYDKIVISLKASNIEKTLDAYKMISNRINYPLHLGITEAGTMWSGTIKSAIGIGSLLLDGIGDTFRVSLTADPVEEIKVAKEILKVLGIRKDGVEIISCPTCARCNIDLQAIAKEIEEYVRDIKKPMTIAIMGCVVNGPGEAKDADIGIAGGKNKLVLFKKGTILGSYSEEEGVNRLKTEIRAMAKEDIVF